MAERWMDGYEKHTLIFIFNKMGIKWLGCSSSVSE